MGSIYRKIRTSYWDDPDIEELFSRDEIYLYIFLLTFPKSTQWGIFEVTYKYISDKTGLEQSEIEPIISKLEHKYKKIVYSRDTRELCLRNGLKWNIEGSNPSVVKHIVNGLKNIKDKRLLRYIVGLKELLGKFDFASELIYSIENYTEDIEEANVPSLVNSADIYIAEMQEEAETNNETTKETKKKHTTKSVKSLYEYNELELPEALKYDAFIDAWKLYIKSRKEQKKPVSATQAEVIMDEFIQKMAEDANFDPVPYIRKSVKNGWQGIFYEEDNGNSKLVRRRERSKRVTIANTNNQDASEGQIV